MCWQAHRTLTCGPAASAHSRQFCTQHLGAVLDATDAGSYIDDALLVISELVTNAVNAGCTEVRVQINLRRDHLHLSVYDEAEGWPERQHPTIDKPHGRGLHIVEQIAISWNVARSNGGKQVSADLVIPQQLTDGIQCHLTSTA